MPRTWSNTRKIETVSPGKKRSPVTPFVILIVLISIYFLWLVGDMTKRASAHPPTQRYVAPSDRE